eukprot:4941604-Alexandrium_andersonii.AAC.1
MSGSTSWTGRLEIPLFCGHVRLGAQQVAVPLNAAVSNCQHRSHPLPQKVGSNPQDCILCIQNQTLQK